MSRGSAVDLGTTYKYAKRVKNVDCGIAVDIGTTNIKMVRVDLATGESQKEYQVKNSQQRFGGDVLSRIQHACCGKLEELSLLVRQDILAGMQQLGAKEKEPVAISCNTTMMALLCKDSVEGMQDFPFSPKRLFVPPQAGVCIAPAAGAFLGGDVVAGLSVLPKQPEDFLFIDLGTNGEMVLCTKGQLLAVSAAAGPAFEYMADASGSLLLEALQNAYRSGAVDETGLLAEPWFEAGYPFWQEKNPAESMHRKEPFLLSQQKIRDLQLAKAAIRTGVDYLLETYEKRTGTPAVPEAVYLAGGMGVVSEEACLCIGMLPEYFRGKCRFLGNTALKGAVKLLLCPDSLEKMKQLAGRMEVHNLAAWDKFNEHFIENINFPEK